MAKVDDNAALAELPLNDERLPAKKLNRHVVVALRHLKTQRENLTLKIDRMAAERDSLDESIKALEVE